MEIDLNKPAKDVDIMSPEYHDMLGKLQANILRSHGRNFARHIFLRFTGQPAAARAWVRDHGTHRVTTAYQHYEQIARRHIERHFDGGLVSGFFLSAKGYAFLGFDNARFRSGAFRNGMKKQDRGLFKKLLGRDNKDPKPSTWEEGFRKEIHALVTVADAAEGPVINAAQSIRASLTGIAEVLTIEEGTVLRRTNAAGDNEPIEHFGYFDGISNPLFTKEDLDDERPENRQRTAWDASASMSLVLVKDPFAPEVDAFGSYLVYRKLGQDHRAFTERVKALAAALNTGKALAGAMVVGRFEDGTPVLQSATPSVGPELANDFNYREDSDGLRCPFHAHIRKANPRGTTPLLSPEDERSRRIVRRGIPYGKPMPGVADPTPSDPNPDAPRGLLFMCFQQNVETQFEFIQRTWIDNQQFPKGILFQKNTGDDPLIGQDREEAQRWPQEWNSKKAGKESFNFESAVTLKGGEYFFAPSIPFLRSL